MAYNTAISTLMILLNTYEKETSITKKDYQVLLTLLNPFAPHITEELNEKLGCSPICDSVWPSYDEAKTIETEKVVGVQINGKLRCEMKVCEEDTLDTVKEKIKSLETVQKYLEGKEIVKVIYVPLRIVNIIIK